MSALRDEGERTLFEPEPSLPPRPGGAPGQGLPAGTLLNNIYEVRGFLARGGMGEVYHGVNVNTEERVAIKVMLPHLAADPKVQAMFRKEARILTELAHPALVRYRLFAHEPQLDLFYIVTEFIDGRPLSEHLSQLRPMPEALAALLRRLAEGLAAAHRMGAIHRDMSPDNVLLPHGRLDQAKIIDFGIARETNLAHQTVVGDSFAGKLGYVAPEQFGDFGRRIGPWTDIYSLGLIGLALAGARAPDMGVTLVDAVDRRREGVDLAVAPDTLKPVFEKMLAPDPSHRFQSMAEVILALEAMETAERRTAPPTEFRPQPLPVHALIAAAHAFDTPAAKDDPEAAAPARPLWRYGAAGGAVALGVIALVTVVSLNDKHSKAGPLPGVADLGPAKPIPNARPAVAVPVEAPPPPILFPATPTLLAPPATAKPVLAKTAPPPPSPVKAAPARPTPPVRAERIERRPLEVAAVAPPQGLPQAQAESPPVANAPAASVEACWRAAGAGWTYLGYESRASCVAKAFNSCAVTYGRWGKTQLRRYDGKLQAKGSGLLSKWQTTGASECSAESGGPLQ